MLLISEHQRYFLFTGVTDMRKGFDTLCGLVRSEMKLNPMSGDMYIFFNRSRTHVKILLWDRDGFALYFKRLERGTFEMPPMDSGNSTTISAQTLALILQGIVLSSIKRKKRFEYAA
ncbi:MAG: IS66 family insertion sequence element accessory protein TnpB [Flavobacteriales bacterium]